MRTEHLLPRIHCDSLYNFGRFPRWRFSRKWRKEETPERTAICSVPLNRRRFECNALISFWIESERCIHNGSLSFSFPAHKIKSCQNKETDRAETTHTESIISLWLLKEIKYCSNACRRVNFYHFFLVVRLLLKEFHAEKKSKTTKLKRLLSEFHVFPNESTNRRIFFSFLLAGRIGTPGNPFEYSIIGYFYSHHQNLGITSFFHQLRRPISFLDS